ncbi:MAG TPA: hypothetical protein PLK77_15380, partial [Pyrinomonadaceae bacterium]|nr:hypothetical protein [Pyrinomonadaceae bacterium]
MTPNLEQIKKSIQALPPIEQDRILNWLEEERERPDHSAAPSPADRSNESLFWLNENREEYLGKWVALDGGRLVRPPSSATKATSRRAGTPLNF